MRRLLSPVFVFCRRSPCWMLGRTIHSNYIIIIHHGWMLYICLAFKVALIVVIRIYYERVGLMMILIIESLQIIEGDLLLTFSRHTKNK